VRTTPHYKIPSKGIGFLKKGIGVLTVKSLSVSSGAGLGAAKPAPEAVALTQNIAAIMIMV
jgi:hypothetical protein